MDASLQKLRSLFSFNRTGDENTEPQHLLDLLESLNAQAPQQVISILLTQYLPAVVAQRNLHMRFKLLENARVEIKRCLPALEQSISNAVLPLPPDIGDLALTADNFLKNLANAYAGIVASMSVHHQDAGLAHLFQQSARRAMQTLLRRQLLAYRAYASPSAASWQQMHDLYRAARTRGLTGGYEEPNIERLYLSALLLAYVDPGKFPRHELETLRDLITALAAMAAIADAALFERDNTSLGARFLVSTDDGSPGQALARTPENAPLFGNFIIECRAIVSALDRRITAGDQPHSPHEAPESMLHAVRTALGGQASRRFSRVRFKPKADLVAGFIHAIDFIASGTLTRREGDPEEITAISEWALINESPDGFGIRYQKGDKWLVQAGDLVVLRTREESSIHVCLVRRIANLEHQRLELGLQELSPQAEVITIASSDGQPMHAILLPRLPAFDGNVGLLVAPGTLALDAEIIVDSHPVSSRWRPGKHAEGNGQVEFHVLEPIL